MSFFKRWFAPLIAACVALLAAYSSVAGGTRHAEPVRPWPTSLAVAASPEPSPDPALEGLAPGTTLDPADNLKSCVRAAGEASDRRQAFDSFGAEPDPERAVEAFVAQATNGSRGEVGLLRDFLLDGTRLPELRAKCLALWCASPMPPERDWLLTALEMVKDDLVVRAIKDQIGAGQ